MKLSAPVPEDVQRARRVLPMQEVRESGCRACADAAGAGSQATALTGEPTENSVDDEAY